MPIRPPWFDPLLLVGITLDGYHLTSLLGSGGFGAVYETADASGQPRAIKVLFPPHSMAQQDVDIWRVRRAHFLNEAFIAAQFQHPNIIRVYAFGLAIWGFRQPRNADHGGIDFTGSYPLAYYIADLIPDGVDRKLREKGLLPPEEAIRIAGQICDALEVLHSASPQILHRDINPGNVRLTAEGRVVLTDFGVARYEGQPSLYVENEGPMFFPDVAAPEQWEGRPADVRTDIFQLAALLLKMLTGQYPRDDGLALLSPRGDVPQPVKDGVVRCLSRNPADRFQRVADFKAALNEAPPLPRHLEFLWSLPLRASAMGRNFASIALDPEEVFVWDNETLSRLDPMTGNKRWDWHPNFGANGFFDSALAPAVGFGNQLLFIRHGDLLSCLRSADGGLRWQQRLWSDRAGACLLAGQALFVDSFKAPGSQLMGPAVLDANNGEILWSSEEPCFHAVSAAQAGTAIALLESRGLGGSGGSRLRMLDLNSGRQMGERVLTTAHSGLEQPNGCSFYQENQRVEGPREPGPAECPPRKLLALAGGTVVAWSGNAGTGDLAARCFDSHLNPCWETSLRRLEAGNGNSTDYHAFLMGAGYRLLAFQGATNWMSGSQQGQISWVEPSTGEISQIRHIPDNGVPAQACVTPDGSVIFLATLHRTNVSKTSRWRILAIQAQTAEMAFLEPEGLIPEGEFALHPVATTNRLFLQVGTAPTKKRLWPKGRPPSSRIEAYRFA